MYTRVEILKIKEWSNKYSCGNVKHCKGAPDSKLFSIEVRYLYNNHDWRTYFRCEECLKNFLTNLKRKYRVDRVVSICGSAFKIVQESGV